VRAFVTVVLGSMAVAATLAAQTPAFEVASIRKNTSANSRIFMDGSGGRYTVTNATLRVLILNAYEILDAQLAGGPRWIESDRFDINASRGDAPLTAVPAMMRTLLAERFSLKVHREMREMPMYTLVRAKRDGPLGAAITPATCDERPDVKAFLASGDRVLPCNVHFVGPGRLRAGGIQMRGLAGILTPLVGRIVIDETGLTGSYDFELSWTPDQSRPVTDNATAPDPGGASLFTAVQEQLGLKLTGGRGPVDVIVIDSVSPPTDN
jgi:uncharacterized protein (TIGR03435 family)